MAYKNGYHLEYYLMYNYNQMKEIRLGLEQHIDIDIYLNEDISSFDMKQIRLELLGGIDK